MASVPTPEDANAIRSVVLIDRRNSATPTEIQSIRPDCHENCLPCRRLSFVNGIPIGGFGLFVYRHGPTARFVVEENGDDIKTSLKHRLWEYTYTFFCSMHPLFLSEITIPITRSNHTYRSNSNLFFFSNLSHLLDFSSLSSSSEDQLHLDRP